MVETLNFHSFLFEIIKHIEIEMNAYMIFLITFLFCLILLALDCAYISSGNKTILYIHMALSECSIFLFYIVAIRWNLNTLEKIHMTYILIGVRIINFIELIGLRLFKIKILDPYKKLQSAREFELFLMENDIDPASAKAAKIQAIFNEIEAF